MAPGDEERDERKPGTRLGEKRRQEVSLEVVDADHGTPEREADPCRDRRSHQERAGESRPLGEGDEIDVLEAAPRALKGRGRQGQKTPHVVAGGELGNDSAVLRVQLDLRMQLVGEEPLARVVERDAGLVAGGFYAEDEQDRGGKS